MQPREQQPLISSNTQNTINTSSTTTKITNCCKSFGNAFFDILTVLITIGDITTDIWVIYLFYIDQRMPFFIIAVVILSLAQCAYAFAFVFRYTNRNTNNTYQSLFLRFGLGFILGPIVSFLIYFTDDHQSCLSRFIRRHAILNDNFYIDNTMDVSPRLSAINQWMMQKLSMHLGFFIESIVEAFPQALLQMVAIVYYREATYVSIVSILLSMLSVMSKSMIFSQGIEWKTYVFTWLCIVTDFYGLFFVISWVFYISNTEMNIVFLNFFTMIGELYVWKFMLGVFPIAFFIGTGYYFYFLAIIFFDLIWNRIRHGCTLNRQCTKDICIFFTMLVLSSVAFVIGVCCLMLVGEICLFIPFSFLLWLLSTNRFQEYDIATVNKKLNWVLSFIHHRSCCCSCNYCCSCCHRQSNDYVIRIASANYGFIMCKKRKHGPLSYSVDEPLLKYILDQKQKTNELVSHKKRSGLRSMTLSDMSLHSRNFNANQKLFSKECLKSTMNDYFAFYSEQWRRTQWSICCCLNWNHLKTNVIALFFFFSYFVATVVLLPSIIIGKLFQLLFPYIIIVYLMVSFGEDIWMSINLFQLIFLGIYIGLQWFIFLFFVLCVCDIHRSLYYFIPNADEVTLKDINIQDLSRNTCYFYDEVQVLPFVIDLVVGKFGADIGEIIIFYFVNIELSLPGMEVDERNLSVEAWGHPQLA